MLVNLMDVNKECLDEIDLPKEDILGITIYDEVYFKINRYKVLKKIFYYYTVNDVQELDYADFIVTVL